MMQKYRKKPVIIEAVQLTKDNAFEVYQLIYGDNGLMTDLVYRTIMESGGMHIITSEGTMKADFGDYIIKGVDGEFYPCKPDIFAKTYEVLKGGKL